MGADYFENFIPILDKDLAFSEAVSRAQYDYGHAGYTGTIAEKSSYKTVFPHLIHRDLVEDWATTYDQEHPHDKWGPANHVAVCDSSDELIGHYFFGWASS